MSASTPPPASDDAYKPISGFALAGAFFGGGFALLALLSGCVAVVKGAPIFYPTWLLLAPVAGVVLCLTGRRQIVGPDATREGLRVANVGLALSLFSGLGYAAYFVAVGLAVSQQANDFLMGSAEPDRGFFAHLKHGLASPHELDVAFLLTQPAPKRIKLHRGDDEDLRAAYDRPAAGGGAGELTRFRQNSLTRMLARAGDRAVVEPLGVREWVHERGSFKVTSAYRVRTPEAVLDLLLQCESSEAEVEGQHRRWFVNLDRSATLAQELTPMGRAIANLRESARGFVDRAWRERLLKSKDAADFEAIDATDWKRLLADAGRQVDALKKTYRGRMREVLLGRPSGSFAVSDDQASWPNWDRDAVGRLRIDVPFRATLFGEGELPPVTAEGFLRLKTTEPIDPEAGLAPAVDWTVEALTFERMRPIQGP